MLSFPNCKINIGLYVTERRNDGFHNIETIFYPLPVHDVLEIVPAIEPQLHLSGREVTGSGDSDNLVWKAYQLLQKNFPGKLSAFAIYLHKVIPMGAGLGGGSADGAFMLRLLNDYCQLSLSKEELISFALQLGSDCPFFIHNTPRFAAGRGELMSEASMDLSDYSIQLICPAVHVSTGLAFSAIKPNPAAYDLRQLYQLPVTEWRLHIHNDFEQPVFLQHPQLADIKKQLYDQGALYASMSGSGSAIYGIFEKGRKAEIKTELGFEVFYLD